MIAAAVPSISHRPEVELLLLLLLRLQQLLLLLQLWVRPACALHNSGRSSCCPSSSSHRCCKSLNSIRLLVLLLLLLCHPSGVSPPWGVSPPLGLHGQRAPLWLEPAVGCHACCAPPVHCLSKAQDSLLLVH
jgi:hypothetical protein